MECATVLRRVNKFRTHARRAAWRSLIGERAWAVREGTCARLMRRGCQRTGMCSCPPYRRRVYARALFAAPIRRALASLRRDDAGSAVSSDSDRKPSPATLRVSLASVVLEVIFIHLENIFIHRGRLISQSVSNMA